MYDVKNVREENKKGYVDINNKEVIKYTERRTVDGGGGSEEYSFLKIGGLM